jgi:hypothetical protein
MTHTKDEVLHLALEPVAWIWKYANGEEEVVFVPPRHVDASHVDAPSTITPLYTAQPAPVQPAKIGTIGHIDNGKATLTASILSALQATPPAAPVQPIAHIVGEIDHAGKVWKPAQRQWVPVTKELLSAQHPWLYESMWIAMKDGSVMTGHYAWMQGRYPDRFLVGDCASFWAFEATHVMPMNQPKHPAKLKEKNQ